MWIFKKGYTILSCIIYKKLFILAAIFTKSILNNVITHGEKSSKAGANYFLLIVDSYNTFLEKFHVI